MLIGEQPQFNKNIETAKSNINDSANGTILSDRSLQSLNYYKGVSGFFFEANGNAEVNFTKFRAYTNADQTITASSVVKVSFDKELFDITNEVYDIGSSNYRFVVRNSGFYWIHAQVYIATTNLVDQKELGIILKKNGSNFVSSIHQTSGTGAVTIKVEDFMQLTAGDYIEVYVSNSVAANLTATADQALTYFSGFRVL